MGPKSIPWTQKQSAPQRVWAGYRLWLARQTRSICRAAKSKPAKLNSDQQHRGEKVCIVLANLNYPISFNYFLVLTVCTWYINFIFVRLMYFFHEVLLLKKQKLRVKILRHIVFLPGFTLAWHSSWIWRAFCYCSVVSINSYLMCISQENTWKHWNDV